MSLQWFFLGARYSAKLAANFRVMAEQQQSPRSTLTPLYAILFAVRASHLLSFILAALFNLSTDVFLLSTLAGRRLSRAAATADRRAITATNTATACAAAAAQRLADRS